MEKNNLSSFFKKYDKLPVPKRHLIDALNAFLGGKPKIKDVSLSKGILYVKTSNAARQELFIKKEKALTFLKEKNFPISIIDIR
jgi:hypothetical protein